MTIPRMQDKLMNFAKTTALKVPLVRMRQEMKRRIRSLEDRLTSSLSIDYRPTPKRRWDETRPHMNLARLFDRFIPNYCNNIKYFESLHTNLKNIAMELDESSPEPRWKNVWIPPLDATSIYSFLAKNNPRLFIEIGSGNSTKFAARAIRDFKLRTQIMSLDPEPRAEVDRLCHRVIRTPLEAANLDIFAESSSEDIIFFDGSHRCLQNSDVTVFFLEVLPQLKKGTLVGIHDIWLPTDYGDSWFDRYYSEQYMLGAWLLADNGNNWEVELPVFYAANCLTETKPYLESLRSKVCKDVTFDGGAFWMRRKS